LFVLLLIALLMPIEWLIDHPSLSAVLAMSTIYCLSRQPDLLLVRYHNMWQVKIRLSVEPHAVKVG